MMAPQQSSTSSSNQQKIITQQQQDFDAFIQLFLSCSSANVSTVKQKAQTNPNPADEDCCGARTEVKKLKAQMTRERAECQSKVDILSSELCAASRMLGRAQDKSRELGLQQVKARITLERKVADLENMLAQFKLDNELLEKQNRVLRESAELAARSGESELSALSCNICMDERCATAFQCGHLCCTKCSDQLIYCHICRLPILQRIHIFI